MFSLLHVYLYNLFNDNTILNLNLKLTPFAHIGGQIEMESQSSQDKIKCVPTHIAKIDMCGTKLHLEVSNQ